METLPKEILRSIIIPEITFKCTGPYLLDGMAYKITDETKTLECDICELYHLIAYQLLGKMTCKLWNDMWKERISQIRVLKTEQTNTCEGDTRPCVQFIAIVSTRLGENDEWYEYSKCNNRRKLFRCLQ